MPREGVVAGRASASTFEWCATDDPEAIGTEVLTLSNPPISSSEPKRSSSAYSRCDESAGMLTGPDQPRGAGSTGVTGMKYEEGY